MDFFVYNATTGANMSMIINYGMTYNNAYAYQYATTKTATWVTERSTGPHGPADYKQPYLNNTEFYYEWLSRPPSPFIRTTGLTQVNMVSSNSIATAPNGSQVYKPLGFNTLPTSGNPKDGDFYSMWAACE